MDFWGHKGRRTLQGPQSRLFLLIPLLGALVRVFVSLPRLLPLFPAPPFSLVLAVTLRGPFCRPPFPFFLGDLLVSVETIAKGLYTLSARQGDGYSSAANPAGILGRSPPTQQRWKGRFGVCWFPVRFCGPRHEKIV